VFERAWSNHEVFACQFRWNSFVDLKSRECLLASDGFAWSHSADCFFENLARGSKVVETMLTVGVSVLVEVTLEVDEVSSFVARYEDFIATHNSNFVALEAHFGDDCGQLSHDGVLSVHVDSLPFAESCAWLFDHCSTIGEMRSG